MSRLHILTDLTSEVLAFGNFFTRIFASSDAAPEREFAKRPVSTCIYVIQSGELVVNDGDLILRRESIFAVWPHTHVRFKAGSGPVSYFWFNFKGNDVEPLLDRIGLTPEKPSRQCPELLILAEKTSQSLSSAEPSDYLPMSFAWQALDALARPRAAKRKLGVAPLYKEIIDSDFANDVRVEDVARQLGVDRTTVYRRFRQAYNLTPRDYLLEVRLDHASHLLRNGSSVKHAALSSGFSDPHYFSRRFRIVFGVPPSHY